MGPLGESLAAWLLAPLVLVMLAFGLGLLVERGARTRIATALLVPVGLCALIVLVMTGLVLFLIVKAYNKMKKAKPESVAPTDIEVLIEIRDELRAQRASR